MSSNDSLKLIFHANYQWPSVALVLWEFLDLFIASCTAIVVYFTSNYVKSNENCVKLVHCFSSGSLQNSYLMWFKQKIIIKCIARVLNIPLFYSLKINNENAFSTTIRNSCISWQSFIWIKKNYWRDINISFARANSYVEVQFQIRMKFCCLTITKIILSCFALLVNTAQEKYINFSFFICFELAFSFFLFFLFYCCIEMKLTIENWAIPTAITSNTCISIWIIKRPLCVWI